jgi:hypothetical protein
LVGENALKYTREEFRKMLIECKELAEKELCDRENGIPGESTISQLKDHIIPEMEQLIANEDNNVPLPFPKYGARFIDSFANAFGMGAWQWDINNHTKLFDKLAKLETYYRNLGDPVPPLKKVHNSNNSRTSENNKIIYIDNDEKANFMKLYCDNPETYTAEIDGKKVKNTQNFIDIMWSVFNFPYPEEKHSLDAYDDWITDLSWINEKNIGLIIKNYKYFLKKNPVDKNFVRNELLPDAVQFWVYECTQVIVEGQPRGFMVFLLD